MKLNQVSFPVYKLKDTPPSKEGDVLFYATQSKKGTRVHIVDDTSLPGTFGIRRVRLAQLELEGKLELFKIKCALIFLADLIKMSKGSMYFIDATGKVFKYTKTRTVPLVYKKITNIIKSIGNTIIEVEGVAGRFSCLYPPLDTQRYAALLRESSKGYLLYGFSEIKQKDTHRKI